MLPAVGQALLPPSLQVSLSVSPERDEECPRGEASAQRVTKELNLGTLPGQERERETLRKLRVRERQTEREWDRYLAA